MFLNNLKIIIIISAKPCIDVTLFKWYVHRTIGELKISIVASFEICRAAVCVCERERECVCGGSFSQNAVARPAENHVRVFMY